jgi:hypothetical protein
MEEEEFKKLSLKEKKLKYKEANSEEYERVGHMIENILKYVLFMHILFI